MVCARFRLVDTGSKFMLIGGDVTGYHVGNRGKRFHTPPKHNETLGSQPGSFHKSGRAGGLGISLCYTTWAITLTTSAIRPVRHLRFL